jgi:eukaryotic-like serine/threonine-protein kinase
MDPTSKATPPPPKSLQKQVLLSTLRWGILLVVLVGTAALSGYLSMRKAVRGGEVAVPTLQGQTLSDADKVLKQAGLLLEKSGERSDPRTEAGKILAQDPPGGARLKRNRKVRVVVSLGAEVLQVPPLVGQPARRAQIALQQAGLRVGEIAYAYDPETAGDRVLAQEPPPGTPRPPQGQVNLLVSKGTRPKVWIMPLVEGVDLAAAARVLSDAGFRVGNIRREASPGAPAGSVLQQYPLAGYPLREGDSVSLVVSSGGEDNG